MGYLKFQFFFIFIFKKLKNDKFYLFLFKIIIFKTEKESNFKF